MIITGRTGTFVTRSSTATWAADRKLLCEEHSSDGSKVGNGFTSIYCYNTFVVNIISGDVNRGIIVFSRKGSLDGSKYLFWASNKPNILLRFSLGPRSWRIGTGRNMTWPNLWGRHQCEQRLQGVILIRGTGGWAYEQNCDHQVTSDLALRDSWTGSSQM